MTVETGIEFSSFERPAFTGDPANTRDILKYLEQAGYTHLAFTDSGDINFMDEKEARADIEKNPDYYVSLGNSNVVEMIENQIKKGYVFEGEPHNGMYKRSVAKED